MYKLRDLQEPNICKEVNTKDMDKILSIFYKVYKKVRPAKRLYKFGTVGLTVFDDRKTKEKLLDYIDEYFFNWQQGMRAKRGYRKYVFKSFFCTSTGTRITSMSEIREKEKRGYAFATMREMEQEADKAKRHIEKVARDKRSKYLEEGYQKIMRGTSNFQKQVEDKIRAGEYETRQ